MQKVQVIIFRKKDKRPEFLLLRKKGEKVFWQGITGGIEASDKSIKDAAIREVKEELSIEVKTKDLIGPLHQFTFITPRKGYEGQEVREFCFGLEISPDSSFQLSDEHDAYKWLPFQEALELIAYDNPKKVVKLIYSMFS